MIFYCILLFFIASSLVGSGLGGYPSFPSMWGFDISISLNSFFNKWFYLIWVRIFFLKLSLIWLLWFSSSLILLSKLAFYSRASFAVLFTCMASTSNYLMNLFNASNCKGSSYYSNPTPCFAKEGGIIYWVNCLTFYYTILEDIVDAVSLTSFLLVF